MFPYPYVVIITHTKPARPNRGTWTLCSTLSFTAHYLLKTTKRFSHVTRRLSRSKVNTKNIHFEPAIYARSVFCVNGSELAELQCLMAW